jgi:hypothetical protein
MTISELAVETTRTRHKSRAIQVCHQVIAFPNKVKIIFLYLVRSSSAQSVRLIWRSSTVSSPLYSERLHSKISRCSTPFLTTRRTFSKTQRSQFPLTNSKRTTLQVRPQRKLICISKRGTPRLTRIKASIKLTRASSTPHPSKKLSTTRQVAQSSNPDLYEIFEQFFKKNHHLKSEFNFVAFV